MNDGQESREAQGAQQAGDAQGTRDTQQAREAALLERIRMDAGLSEAMGGFHLTGWDRAQGVVSAAFTVRPEYCHTGGRIAQGGFVTGWLDAAMAFAVMLETEGRQTVFSLEIKTSFFEKVGPGAGQVQARVVRRGRRVAFLEAWLYNADGQLAARASSTGMLAELQAAPDQGP